MVGADRRDGADDAPGQITGSEHSIGKHRLMRPMERANAQMHDGAVNLLAVIRRLLHSRRQIFQIRFIQTHGFLLQVFFGQ